MGRINKRLYGIHLYIIVLGEYITYSPGVTLLT